jgi:hypothetical protein
MNKEVLTKQLKENIETLDNLIVELSIFELLKDSEEVRITISDMRDILHKQKEKLEEIEL